jgi:hypothetical protein
VDCSEDLRVDEWAHSSNPTINPMMNTIAT